MSHFVHIHCHVLLQQNYKPIFKAHKREQRKECWTVKVRGPHNHRALLTMKVPEDRTFSGRTLPRLARANRQRLSPSEKTWQTFLAWEKLLCPLSQTKTVYDSFKWRFLFVPNATLKTLWNETPWKQEILWVSSLLVWNGRLHSSEEIHCVLRWCRKFIETRNGRDILHCMFPISH